MGNTTSCCCSSQPENENLISSMSLVFDDITQIDTFISYIDQLLEAIHGEARNVEKPDPDRVDSCIKSGGDLLQKILKRANGHACINCKKVSMPKLTRETRKLAIDLAKVGALIKWLGVAFSVVAFVLERFDQISSNQKQCEELLKDFCKLAKNIKRLDKHLPEEMNEVLQLIVEGSLMCVSLMKSDGILSRFFAAPVKAEDLQNFRSKLVQKYSELTLEAAATLLDRIPAAVPTSQGEPSQAVGIGGAKYQVIKLLDMENKSRKIVVIFGQGGIGKTTLATAVFNSLNLNNYKYCRVDMEQNCSEGDLKLLQQKMLRDLFTTNAVLSSWVEGQQELSNAFKKADKPVFMFVDNALKGSDLDKLLPVKELALLPAQSRILLTTRNLNEAQIIRQAEIDVSSHRVDGLPQSEAVKVLCEYALGKRDKTFHHSIDIKGLLEICGGIPLVLRMAGCKLKEYSENVVACQETVESIIEDLRQRGGDAELSERMVDFVYNRLQQSSKDAFQDIVFFFYNWERDRVAYIFGEMQVLQLERAALVNVDEEGRLSVHDIVKARGRMLSDGHRITDEESLGDVVQDVQKIQNTKGIYLPYSSEYKLEAKHLNSMRRSLRVLRLGDSDSYWQSGRREGGGGPMIVNGECRGTFENLRFLEVHDYRNYSQMDLNKLPKLAVFNGYFSKGDKFCEFSGGVSSLKQIYLWNATLENLTLTTLCQHQSLRSLTLDRCEGFTSIPETIGNLSALERLDMSGCRTLVSLPDSFGSLSALERLDMSRCGTLVSLPDSIGSLSALERLAMSYCRTLVSLPDSFGSLSALERLDMSACWTLVSLPDSFGSLSALKSLNMVGCVKLSCLPQNFGELKSLEYLNMKGCKGLRSLSSDFGCLTSLIAIDASECSQLEEKAMDNLAEMKTLMLARIDGNPKLIKRWEQVKHQYSLAVLWRGEPDPWELDKWSWRMQAFLEDIRSTAFFQSESRLVHVDDDGNFDESSTSSSSFPDQDEEEDGVKVAVLLSLCDLTSPENEKSLQTLKKKCVELGSKGFHIIIYVDMVQEGLWEETETRVRNTLPHLPRGTRAWVAADNRATQLFGFSFYHEIHPRHLSSSLSVFASRVSVDKEGSRILIFLEEEDSDTNDAEAIGGGGYQVGGFPTLLATLREAFMFLFPSF